MSIFHRLTVLSALTVAFACSDAALEESGPTLRSVSSNALVVGETVDFYFSGIDFDAERTYRVVFEGNYRSDNGSLEPVQASQKVIEDGYLAKGNDSFSALRLSRFGPFTNPLSTSGRPGRFDGTITVLETDEYGTVSPVVESQVLALSVEPSIIIDSFRPIDSECAAPALRGMAGLAYELEVSVSGLAPVKYTYEIGRANDKPLKVIEHLYDAPIESDRVGDLEALIFNQIDTEEQFYVTSIRVIAEDAEGLRHPRQ